MKIYEDSLSHYGIIGMKWGVRRFQNPDGSLTPEGLARYYGKHETDRFAEKLRSYNFTNSFGGSTGKYIRLANSPQIKNIASRVRHLWEKTNDISKKLDRIEQNFLKRKDYPQWVRKVAQNSWRKADDLEEDGFTLEDMYNWLLNEGGDVDGGGSAAFQLWLKESGDKEAKEYVKNEKLRSETFDNYRSECKKLVQEFMGEHGGEKYDFKTGFGNNVTTHQKDVADRGVTIVNEVMHTWDTYGDDFDSPVPIETYMKLVN